MADIYCNPEKFGLEVVVSLDQPNMSYEFNMFVVWRRKADGVLFYGSDSGCSCPSPFEGVNDVSSLSELKNIDAFEQELNAWGDSFFDPRALRDVVDNVRVVMLYKCTLLTD